MKKNSSISLVIIAKNEELGLKKAITSCRDFVQEVIVAVDSSSTDKTLDVAKEFADRVIVYDWKGSFAEARNLVQKEVKTEWVLHLDGHEYVQFFGDIEKHLNTEAEALFVKVQMENSFVFYYPRIVRKNINWVNKVHNNPQSKLNVKCNEFLIIHDREHFQTKEAKELRSEQRKEMIEGEFSALLKKDRKNERAHFYLGNYYFDIGNYKKAIHYLKKLAKYGEKENVRWHARFFLGVCYNNLGKHLRALWQFFKANDEQPNRWEVSKMLGMTYALLGRDKKALKFWVDSFKINTGEFMFNPIFRNDAETWDLISLAFFTLGNVEKSIIAGRQALRVEHEEGPGLLSLEKVRILEEICGQPQAPVDLKHTIEVCFLVYQRPEKVPKILKQLREQTIQNFRVNIWNNSNKELDVSDFPSDRIVVVNSKENVGSQVRFKLAKNTTGNPIIFFDDDQELSRNFIEYNYRQYLKFGPKCILGWFVRVFNQESYWQSVGAAFGQDVDYVATKAMIFDRAILDNEPLLQNIPPEFAKVEDLYFCYLARMKHNMRMIRIEPYTREIPDGKDQWSKIDKEKAFSMLRKKGWWLFKDGIKNFGGFNFRVRKDVWDEQILSGETKSSYYQMPEKPKVVVDIGAHIGGTAVLAASLGAEVFAYEPERENFNLLLENVKLNNFSNKIHCFKKGVGLAGIRNLYLNPRNSGMAALGKNSKLSEQVEIVSAAEVFVKIEHCDFLKIDCEGAEYEFIKTLPFSKIDNISLELHSGAQSNVLNFLRKIYDIHTTPALDKTSLMVFCTPKK